MTSVENFAPACLFARRVRVTPPERPGEVVTVVHAAKAARMVGRGQARIVGRGGRPARVIELTVADHGDGTSPGLGHSYVFLEAVTDANDVVVGHCFALKRIPRVAVRLLNAATLEAAGGSVL